MRSHEPSRPWPGGLAIDEFGADQRTCFGERARDIIALADEGDASAFEAAEQLLDRQQVGERLQRMVGRRQHIEHGCGVHRRHLLEQTVIEHPRGDDRSGSKRACGSRLRRFRALPMPSSAGWI